MHQKEEYDSLVGFYDFDNICYNFLIAFCTIPSEKLNDLYQDYKTQGIEAAFKNIENDIDRMIIHQIKTNKRNYIMENIKKSESFSEREYKNELEIVKYLEKNKCDEQFTNNY